MEAWKKYASAYTEQNKGDQDDKGNIEKVFGLNLLEKIFKAQQMKISPELRNTLENKLG